MSLPAVVLLFEPQPNEYFNRTGAPARLMRLREKSIALAEYKVDHILCLKFGADLGQLSAQAFIEQVLVKALGAKKVIIGDDFRFGSDRSGDFNVLREHGQRLGFDVVDTPTLEMSTSRVSSTAIRSLLKHARLADAAVALGRRYSNVGRVIYGRQLGRTLGFPTMNVQLGRLKTPLSGVFAVIVHVKNNQYKGVANVGVRPTVNKLLKPILEVHVLDTELSAYGTFIQVDYYQKLRDEMRFDTIETLKLQIKKDVIQARAYFA